MLLCARPFSISLWQSQTQKNGLTDLGHVQKIPQQKNHVLFREPLLLLWNPEMLSKSRIQNFEIRKIENPEFFES